MFLSEGCQETPVTSIVWPYSDRREGYGVCEREIAGEKIMSVDKEKDFALVTIQNNVKEKNERMRCDLFSPPLCWIGPADTYRP